MVCNAVYLNPLANFKQWCILYENKNQRQTIVRLNTVILTNVKLKSINGVIIPTRSSNKLRDDAIRLGALYVCDDSHDEILEKIFSGNN